MSNVLTIVCLVMILAFIGARGVRMASRPISRVALGAAVLSPPVLIIVCLIAGAGRLDALRIAVDSVAKDRSALEQGGALSIGGDAARDDLVLANSPAGLIAARRADGADRVEVRTASDGAGAAVVSMKGGATPLVGAREFKTGDSFCIVACRKGGARWYRLTPDGGGLEIVGSPGVHLTSFARRTIVEYKAFHLGEGLADWTAWQRIYPLRTFGLPLSSALDAGADCSVRYVCGSDGARPVNSFLFRTGGVWYLQGAKLWLMLLDPQALFRDAAGNEMATTPVILPLREDAPLDLSISTVRFDEPDWSHDPQRLADASHLSPARPVKLSLEQGGVRASPGKPDIREIVRQDLISAANSGGTAVLDLYGSTPTGSGAPPGANPLALPALGGTFSGDLRSQLRLSAANDFGRADHAFEFATAGKTSTARLGTAVEARASTANGGQASVSLHIDSLAFPWLMPILATGWAVVSFIAHSKRWQTDATGWMIETTVQLLLALRWLVGLEGAFLDPGVAAASLLASGALAYVAGPMLLAALARVPVPGARRWPILLPFALCAMLSATLAYGRPDWISLGFSGLAGLAMIISDERRRFARVSGWLARVPAAVARNVASWPLVGAVASKPSTRWLTAALVLRLTLLLVFGVKERLSFPAPLAVTVFYLPMVLIGFALFFNEARQSGARPLRTALMFCFWLLAIYLTPALAHDHGFTMMAIPIALWAAVHQPRPATAKADVWPARGLWLAPSVMMAVLLACLLAIGPLLSANIHNEMTAAANDRDEARAAALLTRFAQNNDNLLRIYMIAYPRGLEAAGTLGAEQVTVLGDQLSRYTDTLLGHGFLTPSKIADEIRPVQMSDNVSAIHLISPFGRLGAAALLVLLATLATACGTLTASGADEVRRTLGLLALWSVFGAAGYMILANLQLTPFTGRNVYLLAANSHSDLLEGLTLFAMAQVGLARRSP